MTAVSRTRSGAGGGEHGADWSQSHTYVHNAILVWAKEQPVIKQSQLGVRGSNVGLEKREGKDEFHQSAPILPEPRVDSRAHEAVLSLESSSQQELA